MSPPSSGLNLVERWFAELTNRWLRRSKQSEAESASSARADLAR